MDPEASQPKWKYWYISLIGFLVAIIIFFIIFGNHYQ